MLVFADDQLKVKEMLLGCLAIFLSAAAVSAQGINFNVPSLALYVVEKLQN